MAANPKEILRMAKRAVGAETSADVRDQIAALRVKLLEAEARAADLDAGKLTVEAEEDASSMDEEAARIRRLELPRIIVRCAALERRLADIVARERAAAFDRHRKRRAEIFRKQLVPALEQLRVAQVAAIASVEDARRELGDGLADRIPRVHFHGIPLPDLIDAWRAEMERTMSEAPRPPGRAPRPGIAHYIGAPNSGPWVDPPRGAPKPVTADDGIPGRGPVMLYGGVGGPPRERLPVSAKAPDDVAPLEAGEVRCKVIRAGYESGDGHRSHVGRLVRLRRDIAHKAAAAGAVTIVERFEQPTTGELQ